MRLMIRRSRSINTTLIFVATFLVFLLFHRSILKLIAPLVPNLEALFYDLAIHGTYPTEAFVSSPLLGPFAHPTQRDPKCGDGHILLTPNGPSVPQPGPMILDSKGSLVWASGDFGTTANLQVQSFKGRDYLTFWAGHKEVTAGKGLYYMLDSSYEISHVVNAVGKGVFGDLHEFQITAQGTALITVYNVTNTAVSKFPHTNAFRTWIVDSVLQEIDVESGELLFEWRASDHFGISGSFMTNPFAGYTSFLPFDFYHINSADKDASGNFIISSRHFHSVTCISPTGDILWILGGMQNEFLDMSDGRATNFKWQHHARWYSEIDGILSIFDNEKAGDLHIDASRSRGLLLQLDIPGRKASVLQEYVSSQDILASSQGSLQILPNSGHVFIGWGSAAAYSEYTSDGILLCEVHFGASWFYWFERVKSYRAMKTTGWHGFPTTRPHLAVDANRLCVSWNGATEVAFWALEEHSSQRSDSAQLHDHAEAFETVNVTQKEKFEECFELTFSHANISYPHHYRVAALDAERNVIRYSEAVIIDGTEMLGASVFAATSSVALGFGACLVIFLGVRLFLRPFCRLFIYCQESGLPRLDRTRSGAI